MAVGMGVVMSVGVGKSHENMLYYNITEVYGLPVADLSNARRARVRRELVALSFIKRSVSVRFFF